MNIRDLGRPSKESFICVDEIKQQLSDMLSDDSLNTKSSIVADEMSDLRRMSFEETHITYLLKHPKVNPEHYLSNLRTMIKIR